MVLVVDGLDGDFGITVHCSVDLSVRPFCNDFDIVETGNRFRDGFKGCHDEAKGYDKNGEDRGVGLPHVRCAADRKKNVCPIYFFENSKE